MSDPDAKAAVAALAVALDYEFLDPELAATALRHASFSHETPGLASNERLEFLGDAVLGFLIAEELFLAHPEWSEGDLTRARAGLVNGAALARAARALGFGSLVRLGRTEQRSGGTEKETILANCFEAVIGAVTLDGGIAAARALARRTLGAAAEPGEEQARDPKTAFQEWAHARLHSTPTYRTAGDSGVEDDDARFTVEVRIGDETWGAGRGRSKRAAERCAALEALVRSGALDG